MIGVLFLLVLLLTAYVVFVQGGASLSAGGSNVDADGAAGNAAEQGGQVEIDDDDD